MRVVVDTNLMIRALLSVGPARTFFRLAPLQHMIVYHQEQFAELRDVAARPRLRIATTAIDELVARIVRYGTEVTSALDESLGCRDPNDDYLLAMAVAGAADVILTEDDDLLVLDPWRQVRVVRLFQFMRDYPLVGA
ncbi:MAG TPA: putative toxin-antitoxin system toxin component, PIN family [Phycisphaerae bacterium]|nr:putative toxin-antitoxin system toxin component, PIN family [Phycisphaerales bacterium]HRX86779.1 putative toxin-antitoxin system toxin component, PIN family [Phycisphaerae bacterium]